VNRGSHKNGMWRLGCFSEARGVELRKGERWHVKKKNGG